MDTSAELDIELRKETAARKKQPGHRCLGKQRDGGFALIVGVPTACFTAQQLHSLADIVERYASVSHLSTAQSVILLGISKQNYYSARQAVLEAGFSGSLRGTRRLPRQVLPRRRLFSFRPATYLFPCYLSGRHLSVSAHADEGQDQCIGMCQLLRQHPPQRLRHSCHLQRLEDLHRGEDGLGSRCCPDVGPVCLLR